MIVVRALYGLKSSGASFHSMLSKTLWDLQYRPTAADPDVWIKAATKEDGFKYYEMVLNYVDDVISISKYPMKVIEGIKATFELKGDKAETPDMYLGGSIAVAETANGTKCWTLSSEKYVKAAVANVEGALSKKGLRLPSKCLTQFISG